MWAEQFLQKAEMNLSSFSKKLLPKTKVKYMKIQLPYKAEYKEEKENSSFSLAKNNHDMMEQEGALYL